MRTWAFSKVFGACGLVDVSSVATDVDFDGTS